MSYSPQYAARFKPFAEFQIKRVECKFPGCVMPPAYHSAKSYAYCYAHLKQKQRKGKMVPYTPRTDIEKRWEEWAAARVAVASKREKGIMHRRCGTRLRVMVTHPNGIRGARYCWCASCDVRVFVGANRRQRDVQS